jgi:N-acetyltransferase
MLKHAFQDVDRVVFLAGLQNRRSQRALERIGATRVGERPDANGRPSFVYEISKRDFDQGPLGALDQPRGAV